MRTCSDPRALRPQPPAGAGTAPSRAPTPAQFQSHSRGAGRPCPWAQRPNCPIACPATTRTSVSCSRGSCASTSASTPWAPTAAPVSPASRCKVTAGPAAQVRAQTVAGPGQRGVPAVGTSPPALPAWAPPGSGPPAWPVRGRADRLLLELSAGSQCPVLVGGHGQYQPQRLPPAPPGSPWPGPRGQAPKAAQEAAQPLVWGLSLCQRPRADSSVWKRALSLAPGALSSREIELP